MTDFINHNEHRPKFLNLFKIRMPVTATVSILHRLSGFILFLLLPMIIYGLGLSLKNTGSFQAILDLLNTPIFQMLLSIVSATIFYHLVAGIRFLLLDLNIGQDLKIARASAWIVILMTISLFVWLLIKVLIP